MSAGGRAFPHFPLVVGYFLNSGANAIGKFARYCSPVGLFIHVYKTNICSLTPKHSQKFAVNIQKFHFPQF